MRQASEKYDNTGNFTGTAQVGHVDHLILVRIGVHYLKNILEHGIPALYELSHPRMINARTHSARMNNNRKKESWVTEHDLLKGAEEYFKLNEYASIEHNKKFDQGSLNFSSPVSACKRSDIDEFDHVLAGVVRAK